MRLRPVISCVALVAEHYIWLINILAATQIDREKGRATQQREEAIFRALRRESKQRSWKGRVTGVSGSAYLLKSFASASAVDRVGSNLIISFLRHLKSAGYLPESGSGRWVDLCV